MEHQEEQRDTKVELLVMLNIGSLILVLGSVFMIQLFSVMYGVAAGALAQRATDNSSVAPGLQSVTQQIGTLHSSIMQSYVVLIIALILLATAFLMFIRRQERSTNTLRKYSMMHGAFSFVYLLMMFVVFTQFYTDISFIYVDVIYFGIALCIIIDSYVSYSIRAAVRPKRAKIKNSVSIDPAKPFSNVLKIQEQLFSNLSGNLCIIDKHFSSQALANLHRLLGGTEKNINRINILTSTDMLDSGFSGNINDFRKELELMGISIEVRIMDDNDRIEQHERIMMDDKVAYKVPPFNIINKRSEHINRIGFDEAKRRFDQLFGRAITLENFAIKNARDRNTAEQQK